MTFQRPQNPENPYFHILRLYHQEENMNIGIVCYPTFGGSGVLATELGKALADEGHIIHFIAYQQPIRLDQYHPNIFYHEVAIPSYPLFDYPPYESALSSTIVNVAMGNKLDILHVHYAIPHASAAYYAQRILETRGIYLPYVTTLHGTDITLVGKDKSYAPVVSFSIDSSDAITAVSQSLKSETLDYFDVHKDIEVIYNFVDHERFDKKNLDKYRKMIAPNGEFVMSHASNFRPVKRTEDVITTFAKVREKMPAKLLMVGDGPQKQNNEMLCRELGTCDDILFLGKQEAIEDIYNISDVFILPSESESFGLSALEAMACGVPVISTDTGGLPEVNLNDETGYLCPVGDTDLMAKHALDIAQKPELKKRLSDGAYKQAQKFDIKNIVPLYENLYNRIVVNV